MEQEHGAAGAGTESANLGIQTLGVLLVALAGAPCGLTIADAALQQPALFGLQPGRVWIALVDHWAAPPALHDALPPSSFIHQDSQSIHDGRFYA